MAKKSLTIAEIAKALDASLVGDGSIVVSRVAHPSDVRSAEDLPLAIDKSLLPLLAKTLARAVIATPDADVSAFEAAIIVGRGRYAMAKLTALFDTQVYVAPGVHKTAIIEDGAVLGDNVAIGAFVYVGRRAVIGANSVLHPQVYVGDGAVIGEDALIHSGARIGHDVQIGARAIIHFNATIGADGFSFVTPEVGSVESARASGSVEAQNTQLVRIASLGAVVLGDDVEVGANTSIDRGTIVATRVGSGSKIDNQVQVGHNVVIGENCMLCGHVGIAGSSEIGSRSVLGGAVGVADHVKIGEDCIVMGMSGVAGNLPPKSLVIGQPAKPRDKFIKQLFYVGKLKSLFEKVDAMAKRLAEVEKR